MKRSEMIKKIAKILETTDNIVNSDYMIAEKILDIVENEFFTVPWEFDYENE